MPDALQTHLEAMLAAGARSRWRAVLSRWGVRAVTLNSANRDAWAEIEASPMADSA